jgi:hypothetical protein
MDTRKIRFAFEELKFIKFRSAFNFIPLKYSIDPALRKRIAERGFDVGVHGLKHDGKLFRSKNIFIKRAKLINEFLNEWGAVGFSSPSMHHNLTWMHYLDIEHATTTFDTDPFEPQPDSLGTIFPLFENKIGKMSRPLALKK